jgi:hypothetical protein
LHTRFNNSVEVLSGTFAARPGAGTVDAGTLYVTTDTAQIFRSDGASTWTELGGGGVTDHGALTGLDDDDHSAIYMDDTRHDAKDHSVALGTAILEDLSDVVLSAIASGELIKWDGANWINNTLAEAGISATGHTHSHADTTGKTSDDHHDEAHTAASHSDQGATGAELETLTDGSETTLHSHAGAAGDRIGAGVYRSSALDIANVTTTIVAFDTELFDTDAIHNAATGVFTIPTGMGGLWLLTTLVTYDGAASGVRQAYWDLNAGTRLVTGSLPGTTADSQRLQAVTVENLAAGNTLRVYTWQNSGATRALGVGRENTKASVVYLGPVA